MGHTHAAEQVLELMGVRDRGGITADRVRLAVKCLHKWFQDDDAVRLRRLVEGIDLSKPVERVTLEPPMELIAYRTSPEWQFHQGKQFDPFGMYFTDVGVSKHTVGINTAGRRFVRYALRTSTPALVSTASTGFIHRMGPVHGGSVQYVIPHASRVLRVVHIQHEIR